MIRQPVYADLDASVTVARGGWRPPPKLTLSEWADQFFYLSAESSAQAGRWKTIPYQKGIMDAFTDPTVVDVSVMKSARIGWTKIVNALIGYSIHQDPCPILVVQPTVEDAKGYSKEEIAPMLRDCPALAAIVYEDAEEESGKGTSQTILHKRYPGGVLSMVGAQSGAGFRRISRKRVLCDEVDGYPVSAGTDGDPIKLARKRTEYYWDRKFGAGSTPLLTGSSRIASLFEAGDRRRYYVPCPTCGHMDYLVFTERANGFGHHMEFTPSAPADAHFVCSKNGCVIEHQHKRDMVERGEWRPAGAPGPDGKWVPDRPFDGHASFHIWAAYSYSPNATWEHLATEFMEAKSNPQLLKTFVNTALGETWSESGEAPDWERLYERRETYAIGSVPRGVKVLTCGVDVQKDRWVYEIVGWGAGKESWSIDAGVIPGDTANAADWAGLTALLSREFQTEDGPITIRMMAVDSGYNTQEVYSWVRSQSRARVMAVKGVANARTLVSSPSPVDVLVNGHKHRGGAKVWPVGSSVGKAELYGFLRLRVPDAGQAYPSGFCHFPQHGQEFFKQLTAEHLVTIANKRTRFVTYEWQRIGGRENHWLDCRVYARAGAAVLGLDRIPAESTTVAGAPVLEETPAPAPVPAPVIDVTAQTVAEIWPTVQPVLQPQRPVSAIAIRPSARLPAKSFLGRGDRAGRKPWLK